MKSLFLVIALILAIIPLSRAEIDQNNEAPKLEAILKQNGWDNPTVTEGSKKKVGDGYIWTLEVIDSRAQDWLVVMETNDRISTGSVVSKRKSY